MDLISFSASSSSTNGYKDVHAMRFSDSQLSTVSFLSSSVLLVSLRSFPTSGFASFQTYEMTLLRSVYAVTALLSMTARTQGVTGTAFGFASGATSGSKATPATPSDIAELTSCYG
jgi:hypothetical protein